MPSSTEQLSEPRRVPSKFEGLKRLACVGRDARYNRAIVDLDYPSGVARRTLMIIERDHDVDILRGYRPEALRYIDMGASLRQREFLASRGHTEISLEEAAEWLRSLR